MLVAGLTRYSVDFSNGRKATRGARNWAAQATPFSGHQQPVSSIQYPASGSIAGATFLSKLMAHLETK